MAHRVMTSLVVLYWVAGAVLFLLRGTGVGPSGEEGELIDGTGPPLVVYHIRDWHFVDRDLFGREVGLEGQALDTARVDHLDAVEREQRE